MKVPGQPEVNIGVVGHVDHGKSTLTERLTGERTDRHSEEIKRGSSIRLGYADMAIYKCPKDAEPAAYQNTEICKTHNVNTKLQRIGSFVDSPGHETLTATKAPGGSSRQRRKKPGEKMETPTGRAVTPGTKTGWTPSTPTLRTAGTGGAARTEARPARRPALGTGRAALPADAGGRLGRALGRA